MLIAGDGRSAGAISAGCLESDLRRRLPAVVAGGRAEVAEYDSRSFDDLVWGLGSGCNGRVRVLLSPVTESLRAAFEGAADSLSSGRPVRLETVVAAPAGAARRLGDLRLLASGEKAGEGTEEVIVEEILPPVSLVIAGCGPDAVPLARIAADLGWSVTILADRDPKFVRERFAGLPVSRAGGLAAAASLPVHARSAAVVMSHGFADDAAALEALLPRGFPYLGVLGPRERTRRLFAACGAPPDAAAKIRSPVGADIGAETAAEIALSIAAEIQATLSDRRP
jgi:xanthine/CO dehydrogenase XdhC/CoxF family maturation factor